MRKELADSVLQNYQVLGEKFPADPSVRLETAQVYRVIAAIEQMTGQYTMSQESIERALDIITKLCKDQPVDATYRRWLVEAYLDRGALIQLYGPTGESERDIRLAITLADQLWSEPISNTSKRVKGSAFINLSEIHLLKNEVNESTDAANSAVQFLEPLAEPGRKLKNTTHYRWLLSLALTDRAIGLAQLNQHEKARDDLERAERLCLNTLIDDPEDNEAAFQLVCIDCERAEVLARDRSNFAEAEQRFDRAARGIGKLISQYKLLPQYREQLAVVLRGRSAVRFAIGPSRHQDARKDCDDSQLLFESLIEEQEGQGGPAEPGAFEPTRNDVRTTGPNSF